MQNRQPPAKQHNLVCFQIEMLFKIRFCTYITVNEQSILCVTNSADEVKESFFVTWWICLLLWSFSFATKASL